MKRFFVYMVTIMCLVFTIPFIFTIEFKLTDDNENKKTENEEASVESSVYDYGEYQKIRVQNAVDGSIMELNLDEYLLGVVSAEMPANYNVEALKAQAVVARTYTLYTITHNQSKHGDGIICTDSSCCQAWMSKEDRMNKWEEDKRDEYWNKVEEAVFSTSGEVIEYNGEVIDAFFHANSGGKTEIPANVWGGTDFPYLQTIETSGEEEYSQYSSEASISKKEFEDKIRAKYSDFAIDWNSTEAITISEYTDSGRVKFVKIGNKTLSGVEVRAIFGLKSAKFSYTIDTDCVKFSVVGYGHGVGLSQTGADSMAKNGANYKEIILHFYSNVEIIKL